MTLLEMIKKWEGVKDSLAKPGIGNIRIQGDIDVAEDIIKDLKSIAKENLANETPQKISYRVKISVLKEMERALDQKCYDDVRTLAHTLSLIS